MKRIKAYQWGGIFLVIIALTQSQILVNYDSAPSILGFPQWMIFFVLFHVIFIIALYFFIYKPK